MAVFFSEKIITDEHNEDVSSYIHSIRASRKIYHDSFLWESCMAMLFSDILRYNGINELRYDEILMYLIIIFVTFFFHS